MKKKFLAVILSLTMAVSMLAGCGSSQEDYENDIEVFEDIEDIDFDALDVEDEDDVKDAINDLKKEIKKLDFSTKEGKEIRNLLLDVVDMMGDYLTDISKLDEDDDDAIDKYFEISEEFEEKTEDLYEKLEDAVEDFIDAAEDAGVDEDDLEDLSGFGL